MSTSAGSWNPPPGWPTPFPGWAPEEGWQPDPRWPPAPAGWVFWHPVALAPHVPEPAPQRVVISARWSAGPVLLTVVGILVQAALVGGIRGVLAATFSAVLTAQAVSIAYKSGTVR